MFLFKLYELFYYFIECSESFYNPLGKTGGIHTAGGQVTSANTKEGRTTDKAQVPHVGPDGSRTTVSGQVSNSSLPDTRTSASGPVSQVNQQGKRTSQGSPDGHHSTVSVRDGNGSQNNDGATNKPGATVGALGHDSSNPGKRVCIRKGQFLSGHMTF